MTDWYADLVEWYQKKKIKRETLVIFMKSGNTIVLYDVIDWKVERQHNVITELMIDQDKKAEVSLIWTAIDLSQIEAITVHH